VVTPPHAALPPAGMPGLDPAWSRSVRVRDADGITRTFHVLDSWVGRTDEPAGTLLAVHGNPTWSYLWRRLFEAAPPGWRVVAPDQLGMGWSERPERARVVGDRVDDLCRLTDALGITGPVVTVAHDWGGIISLGWALRHRAQLRGVVLTNTAVHQPAGDRGPLLIRLAHLPLVNTVACRLTPLFVRATTSLTWPRLPKDVRDAFAAPYRTIARRRAVGEFVADIPFAAGHPSHRTVEDIAEGIVDLDVPVLLLWGPRDPVFGDIYLRDLRARLPQAVLHRYEKASHLLPEDAPGYAAAVADWVRSSVEHPSEPLPDNGSGQAQPVLARLDERAGDDAVAVVEVGGSQISWAQLHRRVQEQAAAFAAAGLRPGDRVALLIPPSIDLTVALYAVWRAGGVIVVVDRGLGLRGMGRALRAAAVDAVVGGTAGLLASRAMRVPGRRLGVGAVPAWVRSLTGAQVPVSAGGSPLPPPAAPSDQAAVLYTSGATGPAKGVLYRHRQVRAQLELIRTTYGLTAQDRIVAAFAPFALYGPALGIPSAVPRTDVTKPGTLTAAALAEAARAVGATIVFASPAALRNVVATAAALTATDRAALARVRLVMSAGASVPVELLREVAAVLPNAEIHTPYGMTEALPLTDISLEQIEEAGTGDGVCVGRPLPGVELAVGTPSAGDFLAEPGVTGEIWARAAHVRDRYDASWVLDREAAAHPGWHRTGDVGCLDAQGRLWIRGRSVHVVSTADGPVTPVGLELDIAGALATHGHPVSGTGVAVVGVGPAGTQQVVVVIESPGGPVAPPAVAATVRDAVRLRPEGPTPRIASVLLTPTIPVDIRHNSKIDRAAVARWAAGVLAGG
jgi:olefin beta-lactone synthetase